MKKIWFLLIIFVFFITIGCESTSGGSAIGDQAYDFTVEDYNGNSVKLSDFKDKTIFLLAWTTT